MSRSANSNAVWMLLLCTFFWGACFPVGKHALHEVSALTLVLWRFGVAASCLLIYAVWAKIRVPRLTPKQWLWAIMASIVGVGGLNLCLFTGLTKTDASNGALIMALSPLTTSLMGTLWQRKLPHLSAIFSLIICLSGVMLVLTNGELSRLLGFEFNQGDQLIFVGMLCWSLYTCLTQSISRWFPMIPFTLVGMMSGTGVISLMLAFSAEVHPWQESLAISSWVLADLLFIGVFGTVGGYLLWISGVKQLGAATASLFFNFVPVFAVLTALIFGQSVTELQLLGMAIVIAGLLLPRILGWLKQYSAVGEELEAAVEHEVEAVIEAVVAVEPVIADAVVREK
ncbi:DMT family transporter [Amphritea opalescens]|uniref:DMT family transporter n=1 Tax=Amphritea opalescens TaxID=2490544 RepID=A0A430KSJ9_9GAMM|nr:DMT family transporter [Amphritea opalescens]RTE66479.1 DMT family transporter [Amphritea opalescens]